MPRFTTTTLACLVVASCATSASTADDLSTCAGFEDDSARLACYDGLAGRPRPDMPKAVADFGVTEQLKRERDPETWIAARPESVTRTVKSVGRNASDRLVVTLEDGQVWLQTETKSHVPVRPGDVVVIKRAAMGTFMLLTPSSVATRVRRVQ